MIQKISFKSIIALLFFLNVWHISYTQRKLNGSIHIDGNHSKGGKFKAIVYNYKKNIKVIYKIEDSISYKANEDSLIEKYLDRYQKDSLLQKDKKRLKDSVDFFINFLEYKYTYYSTDSLWLRARK